MSELVTYDELKVAYDNLQQEFDSFKNNTHIFYYWHSEGGMGSYLVDSSKGNIDDLPCISFEWCHSSYEKLDEKDFRTVEEIRGIFEHELTLCEECEETPENCKCDQETVEDDD